jgi:hypothetical protein
MGELVPNSTLTPHVRLFGPDGALLDQFFSSGAAAEVSVQATNNGTFTVVATDRSSGYTGSGTYRLKLAKTGSPIITQANDDGGPMTGEVTYDGTLDTGDLAVWDFTACAGNPISLGVTELVGGSSLTPWLRVFNRDGLMLKTVSGAGTAQTSFVAPDSGTFTVVLADLSSAYAGSGTYRLTVNGLSTGLKVCPPNAGAGQPYTTIIGGDPNIGFSVLTTTNVETPKALWDVIPTPRFDRFNNLNYTNFNPTEDHRFFRWLLPSSP